MELNEASVTDVVGSVENIGPLSAEDSVEEFSFSGFFSPFSGASEYLSISGTSCSTRRRREESSEGDPDGKRLRWSDESD